MRCSRADDSSLDAKLMREGRGLRGGGGRGKKGGGRKGGDG